MLPAPVHRVAIMTGQVCIGDPVVIAPGLYLPHGQVVIDGLTASRSQVVIRPFVTIGLRDGYLGGPTIGKGVSIGTGPRSWPVRIGVPCAHRGQRSSCPDVPVGTTAVGAPTARVVSKTGSEMGDLDDDAEGHPARRAASHTHRVASVANPDCGHGRRWLT